MQNSFENAAIKLHWYQYQMNLHCEKIQCQADLERWLYLSLRCSQLSDFDADKVKLHTGAFKDVTSYNQLLNDSPAFSFPSNKTQNIPLRVFAKMPYAPIFHSILKHNHNSGWNGIMQLEKSCCKSRNAHEWKLYSHVLTQLYVCIK